MASYRERLTQDLDRWIADGLVSSESRSAILATVPDGRRLEAATALAWVGGVLMGVAAITFIAANWDAIPRLGKFVLVLLVYAVSAGLGAAALRKDRPGLSNGILTFAALIFASAIGLSGQIFDITGDPQMALYSAAVSAAALAMAGRASGPFVAALVFVGIADFMGAGFGSRNDGSVFPWLALAAPLAGALAFRWRSVALAHSSAMGLIAAAFWIGIRFEVNATTFFIMSLGLAGLAAAARWRSGKGERAGAIVFGWLTWGALIYLVIAGYADGESALDIPHRLVWLAAAAGTIAVGRHDRHALVTGAGVLGILAAVAALLQDFGLNLMAAAAIFLVTALAALIVGLLLSRRAKP